jgi:hypothetical protein
VEEAGHDHEVGGGGPPAVEDRGAPGRDVAARRQHVDGHARPRGWLRLLQNVDVD